MEEKVTQKDRILAFWKRSGLSMRHFESSVHVSNGYFKQLKSKPSSRVLEGILAAFPELRRDWVLYGSGEMLESKTQESAEELATMKEYVKHLEEEIVFLKNKLEDKDNLINLLVANGTGANNSSDR